MSDQAWLDLHRVRRTGRKAVLVTVVRSSGPNYRGTGASAVVAEGGVVIGAVSGGCLQTDILAAAEAVIGGEAPRLLAYNTGTAEDLLFGTGSGCGGTAYMLVAPVVDDLLEAVVGRLKAGQPVVVETNIAPGPALGQRGLGEFAAKLPSCSYAGDLFRQVLAAPTTLLVCGAGDDARPVVSLAAGAGFRVIVVDHRPAWVSPERFPEAEQTLICDCEQLPSQLVLPPGSYAVLMTHQFERDLSHLRSLLERPLAYVGLLGSRDRARKLVTDLLQARPDLGDAVAAKLRAPVGLDIGADGPFEIALSVVAELVACRSGRPGNALGLFHREATV